MIISINSYLTKFDKKNNVCKKSSLTFFIFTLTSQVWPISNSKNYNYHLTLAEIVKIKKCAPTFYDRKISENQLEHASQGWYYIELGASP